MSSGYGAGYSWIDREAARRRELRAEVAVSRERLWFLRDQVAAATGAGSRGRRSLRDTGTPAGATSEKLAALAADLAGQVDAARRELDEHLGRRWAGVLAPAGAPAAAVGRDGRPGGPGRTADHADQASHTGEAERDRVRADAVATAESLLRTDGNRCDAGDLHALDALLTRLRAEQTVPAARARLFEIRSTVAESIERRRTAERVELARGRLVSLTGEALPEERAALRSALADATEPESMAATVAAAVARADRARARVAVAEATVAALEELGCQVGPDFATLLAGGDTGVAAFGDSDQPGYGLAVRLRGNQSGRSGQSGQDGLAMAVVRHSDRPEDPAWDLVVQQRFCDTQLSAVVAAIQERGIVLNEETRIEPGVRPPATVGPDNWPGRSAGHAGQRVQPDHTQVRRSRTTARERQRER